MKSTLKDSKLIITMDDHIDAVNASDVQAELMQIVEESDPYEEIILDAASLTFISSAGFRVLFTLREDQPKPVIVINVSPAIYEIFEVTGFTELMEIHAD